MGHSTAWLEVTLTSKINNSDYLKVIPTYCVMLVTSLTQT